MTAYFYGPRGAKGRPAGCQEYFEESDTFAAWPGQRRDIFDEASKMQGSRSMLQAAYNKKKKKPHRNEAVEPPASQTAAKAKRFGAARGTAAVDLGGSTSSEDDNQGGEYASDVASVAPPPFSPSLEVQDDSNPEDIDAAASATGAESADSSQADEGPSDVADEFVPPPPPSRNPLQPILPPPLVRPVKILSAEETVEAVREAFGEARFHVDDIRRDVDYVSVQDTCECVGFAVACGPRRCLPLLQVIQFDSALVLRIAWHALFATKADSTAHDEFWSSTSSTELFVEPSRLATLLSVLVEVSDGEAEPVLTKLLQLLRAHRRNCVLFWQFGLATAIDTWDCMQDSNANGPSAGPAALIEQCIRLAEPFAKELHSAAQLLSLLRISAAASDSTTERKCSPKRVQFVFDLLRSSVEADARSRNGPLLVSAPRCYFDLDGIGSALLVRSHSGVRPQHNMLQHSTALRARSHCGVTPGNGLSSKQTGRPLVVVGCLCALPSVVCHVTNSNSSRVVCLRSDASCPLIVNRVSFCRRMCQLQLERTHCDRL